MADRQPDPVDDGALSRAADRRAEEVDDAATPVQRRRAWVRFLPAAIAALAEGFARDSMIAGTVALSLILLIGGLLSGDPLVMLAATVVGIGGAALIVVAIARRWPIGRQWAAMAAVLVLDVALIALWV